MGEIRTFTNLNRAILKNKQGAVARVWYLLRMLDVKGQGWVFKNEFFHQVAKNLTISQRASRGIYQRGLGIWWDEVNGNRINIHSLIRMANHFGVKPGYSVKLPSRVLKTLLSFNSHLHATFFTRDTWKIVDRNINPAGGKTITMKMLSELFGVSKTTLRKWHDAAGVKKINQYAFSKEINLEHREIIPFRKEIGCSYDIDNDGEQEFVWQLPNKYSTPNLEASRTCLNRDRGLSVPKLPDAKPWKRVFYDDPNALKKIDLKSIKDRTVYIATKPNVDYSFGLYEAVNY